MNEDKPPHLVEDSARSLVRDLQHFAGREPVIAVAAAFGVGLLLNLLPTRVVAGTVAAVGATLLRPALMTLGVIKAVELCCQKPSNQR